MGTSTKTKIGGRHSCARSGSGRHCGRGCWHMNAPAIARHEFIMSLVLPLAAALRETAMLDKFIHEPRIAGFLPCKVIDKRSKRENKKG